MIDAIRWVLLGWLVCIVGACAMNEAQSSVAKSQAADVGTTALGLSLGFVEANPLGLAVLPLKAVAIKNADCKSVDTLNTVTYAASGWNLAMIVGAGGFIGVPVAILLYNQFKVPCMTEQQRLRYEWDSAIMENSIP